MLVCFDATVLCAALRKPTGHNFKLLELAADGVVVGGFTTLVAGMEFVRNALEGLSGVVYGPEQLERFLEHFEPLFNPDDVQPSPIGGALPAEVSLQGRPIGEVLYELTGRRSEQLLEGLPRQLRLIAADLDAFDLHLLAAASERGADVICSANRMHLPEGALAGGIEVIRPGRLAAQLGLT